MEYTSTWPCIKPSKIDEFSAFCEICSMDFKISHGGRDDCRRHVESKRHKDLARVREGNQSVRMFFPNQAPTYSDSDLAVMKSESMLVKILADYNLPISAADRFTTVFKMMFPDSAIAKQFKCSRSKSTAVLKEMAVICKETLYKRMKSNPFTISTDGSNDKGNSKQFPLIVRSVDLESNTGEFVSSEILSIPTIEGSATGRRIFDLIAEEFESHNIPWDHCMALGCDNANVMVGREKGVFGCLTEKHPTIILLGCICHLLHIAAKKGSSVLPARADEVLIDAYYYLEKSSLRQHNLKEFQILYDVKQHKILKHVHTRWLSLASCIDRLIENWQPLSALIEKDLTIHLSKSSSSKAKSIPAVKQTETSKPVTKESSKATDGNLKSSDRNVTVSSSSDRKVKVSSLKSTFFTSVNHTSDTTLKKKSSCSKNKPSSVCSAMTTKTASSTDKNAFAKIASTSSKLKETSQVRMSSHSHPVDQLQRMNAVFKSPLKKLYLFLQAVLPLFIKVNLELQEEAHQIHLVRRKMLKLLRTLYTRFLKPAAMTGKEMTDVNFPLAENHSPVKNLLIGDSTADFLHECLLKKFISTKDENTFYINVIKFFETSCSYIIKKIPFYEPLLKHIEIMDPTQQYQADPASLKYFLDRFPILRKDISREQIMAELTTYKSCDISAFASTTVDAFWKGMLFLKDEEGEQLLKYLPRIMLFLATIPHSSAHCERIFSCVRQTHTDQRASLGAKTIESLMIVKANGDKIKLEDGQLRRLKSCYSQSLSK